MKRHKLVAWENGLRYTFRAIPGEWNFSPVNGTWYATFTPRGERYPTLRGTGTSYFEAIKNAQKIDD